MHHIRDISWTEIQENWHQSEDNEIWQDFYKKKGFQSWEDWRWARQKLLRLADRHWILEKPDHVIEEVRGMFCDATTRWTDFYTHREQSTFGHLKDHPDFLKHARVQYIRENFPHGSQMIGLRNKSRIILPDGHHRATAIAGMDGSFPVPDVNFAIADVSDEEFKKLYESGNKLKLERRVWDIMGLVRSRIKPLF